MTDVQSRERLRALFKRFVSLADFPAASFDEANSLCDLILSALAADPVQAEAPQFEWRKLATMLLSFKHSNKNGARRSVPTQWRGGTDGGFDRFSCEDVDLAYLEAERLARIAEDPKFPPVQLQDGASPEWTCQTCGGDLLFCKCSDKTGKTQTAAAPSRAVQATQPEPAADDARIVLMAIEAGARAALKLEAPAAALATNRERALKQALTESSALAAAVFSAIAKEAASQPADDLEKILQYAHRDFTASACVVVEQLIERVRALQRETRPQHPVAAFLSRLPDIEAPEISIEDDSDVCFDWWRAADATVSASLRVDGLVMWAALIGGRKQHGRFQLTDWPDDFQDALKRFTAAANRETRAPQPPDYWLCKACGCLWRNTGKYPDISCVARR